MSEIKDSVKEQMLEVLFRKGRGRWSKETIVDEILSIPELAIVDREAELPIGTFDYEQHKRICKEAGWVKEIK